jgi:dipeptidyl aminopeptidase/acylaminoacyl peptidase
MSSASNEALDAVLVARKKLTCDELTASAGALWWLQSDPDIGGTVRLMSWRNDVGVRAISPQEMPIGGWLHGYGGGSYARSDSGTWIVGSHDSSLYFLDAHGQCTRTAPAGDDCIYGDLSAAGDRVLAVRERPDGGDEIVEVAADGRTRVLVSSPGFLGAPRLHGDRLLFLEWDADRMPWDATALRMAHYERGGALGPSKQIAGGPQESVVQPAWGPDGAVYFMSDRTGWWNLYRWDQDGARRLVAIDQDCAAAPWEGGYQSYVFLSGGRVALTVHDGLTTALKVANSVGETTSVGADVTSVKPYLAVVGGQIAVIGSSPTRTPSVLLIDADQTEASATTPLGQPPSGDDLPTVTRTELREVTNGVTKLRFLLRLPLLGRQGLPLLVRAHPGPTDDVPLRRDVTADFFTSRGFAVADVAYRGSSGQGRAFRKLLDGHWGEYDVDDCAAVAEHLLSDGTARPGAVFISGASAGGYTALQAVCRSTPFAAATATSAIINPACWATRVPRFQRPHAAILEGPAGAVRAERVTRPVLLIHGSDDAIAPAEDAMALAEQLRSRDSRHRALFLEDGGHYLSHPRCREAALTAEWEFYRQFIEP